MKISQKQANLLAKEILKQLKRENIGKVSELTIAKLKAFKEKREALIKAKNDAEAELNKFDATLRQIVGNNTNVNIVVKKHFKLNSLANNESCSHNKKELGYMQWMRWAEENESKGITQSQCPICKHWLYPEEFKPPKVNNKNKDSFS